MLSSEEITGMYTELGTMFVQLDPRPELGLGYIRERLTLCRAMQDRAGELRLKAQLALSEVQEKHLIAQHTQELQPTPDHKQAVKQLEMERLRHQTLVKMIGVQTQLLSRSAMDIRLLLDITKQQMQRGEIDPKDVQGLVKDVPIGALSPLPDLPYHGAGVIRQAEPFPPATAGFDGALPGRVEHIVPPQGPVNPAVSFEPVRQEPIGPDSFGGSDYPQTPEQEQAVNEAIQSVLDRPRAVETVGLDAVVPAVPPHDDRVKMADTHATTFDEIFAGATHGNPRIF